jgi:hypothetical protein
MSDGVSAEMRADLRTKFDQTTAELDRAHPSSASLLDWLGGIGAVVGTIGSAQPAYETVKSVARAMGLHL